MIKRMCGLFLFTFVLGLASEAQGQWQDRGTRGGFLFGGRLFQNREVQRHQHFNQQRLPSHYQGNIRQIDPYNFYDTSQPYPKYYGAFHYSHFSRMGVPHGDIGFNSNGIYWSPW